MGEERKYDVDVWIDLDKYWWWRWNTVPIQGLECRNTLKTSPLVQQLFRSDINIVLEDGFRVEPYLNGRKLQYFLVDGNQLWPLFVEGKK